MTRFTQSITLWRFIFSTKSYPGAPGAPGPNVGPLQQKVNSSFSFFSWYLCNGVSSVDPILIWTSRAPGLFIAQIIFREMLFALAKTCLLRCVTLRHVLSKSIYTAARGHLWYSVSPLVNYWLIINLLDLRKKSLVWSKNVWYFKRNLYDLESFT